MKIDYYDYIASNMSQFGVAIFDSQDYHCFNFEDLKKTLKKDSSLDKMYVFPLIVYESENKALHTYWAFVNGDNLSPFVFFDKVRSACASHKISKFYACDFETEKIYEMSSSSAYEYGKLSELKNLLRLDDKTFIVGKFMKWSGPPGYLKFYREPRVFRNLAEQEYYAKYGKYLSQYSNTKLNLETFYSWSDCERKTSFNRLEFDKRVTLEFDIDNPDLNIKATSLKARDLTIRSIKAEEIFCDNLICESVEADKIYAEHIECKEIKANIIKTNFAYGLTIEKLPATNNN